MSISCTPCVCDYADESVHLHGHVCATMSTRVCNFVVVRVRICRRTRAIPRHEHATLWRDCATPQPSLSPSRSRACATMQTRVCNFAATHVRLCRQECATLPLPCATMRTRLCNPATVREHLWQPRVCNYADKSVKLRLRMCDYTDECATPPMYMSISRSRTCATVQTRVCNFTDTHMPLCLRERATPRSCVCNNGDKSMQLRNCGCAIIPMRLWDMSIRVCNSKDARVQLCRQEYETPRPCVNYHADESVQPFPCPLTPELALRV